MGRIHNPHCRVVRLYVEQFHETDIGRGMAARYGVPLVKRPAAVAAAKAGKWPVELVATSIAAAPKNRRRPFSMDRLKRAIVFRVEYSDGFVAAVCTGPTGLTSEFTFAAKVRGREKPVGTCAVLPKPQRDHFSFLCNHIEVMFRSEKPSYPVERTLLVTGVLDALHDSRAAGGKRIETPHLAKLAYTPAVELSSG